MNVERKVLDRKSGIVLGAVEDAELASRAEVDESVFSADSFQIQTISDRCSRRASNDFCCDSVARAEEILYSNMGAKGGRQERICADAEG